VNYFTLDWDFSWHWHAINSIDAIEAGESNVFDRLRK
jgi:hypothetical protein